MWWYQSFSVSFPCYIIALPSFRSSESDFFGIESLGVSGLMVIGGFEVVGSTTSFNLFTWRAGSVSRIGQKRDSHYIAGLKTVLMTGSVSGGRTKSNNNYVGGESREVMWIVNAFAETGLC